MSFVTGGLASGPEAYFDNLPHKSILTLNVLPPEGWLVESVRAVHDLDNIKLEQVRVRLLYHDIGMFD